MKFRAERVVGVEKDMSRRRSRDSKVERDAKVIESGWMDWGGSARREVLRARNGSGEGNQSKTAGARIGYRVSAEGRK